MTNKELEKKIEELSAQIEALKSELKEETPKGEIWKPKEDEEYWWVNEYGLVCFSAIKDKDVEKIGNCYPTKEKAEYEAQREKYTRLFRQYVEQHSEPLDWEDSNQEKCLVCYDWKLGFIRFAKVCNEQGMEVYGSSEELMREAVEFVGEENVKRYVLGVEE